MSVDKAWFFAANRFGFGLRSDGADGAGDAKQALIAEISDSRSLLLDAPGLLTTAENQVAVFADEAEKKRQRDLGMAQASPIPLPNGLPGVFPPPPGAQVSPAAQASPAPTKTVTVLDGMTGRPEPGKSMGEMAGGMMAAPAMAQTPPPKPPESPEARAYRTEALARLEKACAAPIGFGERWVAFWSNHFCVSISKSNLVHVSAGAFEREAIRPHALGRFVDMLVAVEQHPAMLHFLDNQNSIGPDSKAAKNRKAGLNENLAREILELHTMGVGSGYSQADVTALARVITGWSSVGAQGKLGEPGTFVFNANAHQPGPETVLGRVYAQTGVDQGQAALGDIAATPATAQHIARKLAKAFVADDPDPKLVAGLAKVFSDTGGDLSALAKALIMSPEAWAAPAGKIRNPWEWLVASNRALGQSPNDPGRALNALRLLGQPLWQPAGPNGFSDDTSAWLSPEGLKTRVEVAAQFAKQVKDVPNPVALTEAILGPGASADTRQTIARAETPEQAYALLILAPEFMRR